MRATLQTGLIAICPVNHVVPARLRFERRDGLLSVWEAIERLPPASIRRVPQGPYTNFELLVDGRFVPTDGTERKGAIQNLPESYEILEGIPCDGVEAIRRVEPV